MDGLWAADIEIVLIHTLINMLLMYRSGAVRLSKETHRTATLSIMHCAGIGFSCRGNELVLIIVKMMNMIITSGLDNYNIEE